MTDTPADLLRRGDLDALRALFAARVRAEPARAAHRLDLADVLIVQGELERADNHLALAADQDVSLGLAVSLTRQLVRAATARGETLDQRRPPEVVAEPDAALTAALERLAGRDSAGEVELSGTANDTPFEGIRDLDDRTPAVLEVMTSTGKYCWVSLATVSSLRLQAAERLRDVVWRPAELDVRGGPSGVVYLPAIYHAAAAEMTDAHRLGRATDWVEEDGRFRGMGLRSWLVGEDEITIDELRTLEVA